jgi:hypothetical protein
MVDELASELDAPMPRRAKGRCRERDSGETGASVGPGGFYADSLSESERELLEAARSVDGLAKEIAALRVKLFTAVKEHPEDFRLMTHGIGMLVRAVATQCRLSPKARRDLADSLASVLNGLGDQILPADR